MLNADRIRRFPVINVLLGAAIGLIAAGAVGCSSGDEGVNNAAGGASGAAGGAGAGGVNAGGSSGGGVAGSLGGTAGSAGVAGGAGTAGAGGGAGGAAGTGGAAGAAGTGGAAGAAGAAGALPEGGTGGTAGDGGVGNLVVSYPKFDTEVNALLAKMTIDEKIGQMVQVEIGTPVDPNQQAPATLADVTTYRIGGGLFLGPMGATATTAQQWADRVKTYQQAALATPLKIPMIIGIDAVHGHGYFDGPSVIFPHNIGLGATRDPALVMQVQAITASELAATGVKWAFAPCLAVVRDIRWGRTYEAFGETTEMQQMFAAPSIIGFQGRDLTLSTSVVASGKHWIAEGETKWGTGQGGLIDRGDAQITDAELRARHMPGYVDAIKAGAQVMMASFSKYNGVSVHGSTKLLTDILKTELGFDGFVVSDWRGVYETGVGSVAGINAGIDMHMLPDSFGGAGPKKYTGFITEVKTAVTNGQIAQARIDDAVKRILRVKYRLGLFTNAMPDASLVASVGSAEHRAVARQAVRESMVLLKNDNKVLPLAKDAKVVVVGAHGDNPGLQSGGWTKGWQGIKTTYPGATSILAGIKAVSSAPANVTYSADGSALTGASVAVIVVGEDPYSEFMGDKQATFPMVLSAAQKGYFDKATTAGIPIVMVLISGRPIIIPDEITKSAAIIAAWLPGSEGTGVADVLYGDYKPTGKLSVSWPKALTQIPMHFGDATYDPQFAYGFGLTYP